MNLYFSRQFNKVKYSRKYGYNCKLMPSEGEIRERGWRKGKTEAEVGEGVSKRPFSRGLREDPEGSEEFFLNDFYSN